MNHVPFHDLKTWPAYFDALWRGVKAFEMRYSDRPYAVGDVLWLREWRPAVDWNISRQGVYTGRSLKALVTYILDDDSGREFVPDGWCILSIREIPGTREE